MTITHLCPAKGSAITRCCGRSPFELPIGDRITLEDERADCPSVAVLVQRVEREAARRPMSDSFDQIVGRPEAYLDGRADVYFGQALRSRHPLGWRARLRVLRTGRILNDIGRLIAIAHTGIERRRAETAEARIAAALAACNSGIIGIELQSNGYSRLSITDLQLIEATAGVIRRVLKAAP